MEKKTMEYFIVGKVNSEGNTADGTVWRTFDNRPEAVRYLSNQGNGSDRYSAAPYRSRFAMAARREGAVL